MFSGGAASEEVVAELRALRDEFGQFREEHGIASATIAGHTRKTAQTLESCVDGGALVTTTA
jgi:hypothetical protein